MGFYKLDCGCIRLPHSAVGVANPEEAREVPLMAYLVACPEGWVLYDAGCDPQTVRGGWPPEWQGLPYTVRGRVPLPQRLAERGVSPDDIRWVVAPQLRPDHTGCLPLFREANIVVSGMALGEALRRYVTDESAAAACCGEGHWLCAELRWLPLRREVREFPLGTGVTALHFAAGSSRGVLGLLVERTAGNLLLVPDTACAAEDLATPPPGFVGNPEDLRAAVAGVRRCAWERNAAIVCGCDRGQLEPMRAQVRTP